MSKNDVVLINSDESADEVDDEEINILESDKCSTSESESISEGEHEDIETGETSMSIYYRLRLGISKIKKSLLLRGKFREACHSLKLKPKILFLDVKTRWNSTYLMLKRAFEYRKAFDLLIRDCKFLRKLLLSKAEWCLIADMVTFLQPFYNVTLQLSKSKSPSMALTAAVYIALYEHLESFKKGKVGADMLNAAEAACDKLNKYYPDSDGLVYIMGLLCDPRCKLQWYRIVGISKQVISQNKQAALSYWNEYYNVFEDETVVDETTSSSNNLIAAQI
ncbi:unnamed protein product [Allacma fusca]|uniref:Uncharacterized protein n=1 Tax=Allacma fusca TaxID=39272 RepID=A0A8J2K2V5_9HEXA|nr:unnamed protein product [Allacma fusca]